MSEKTAMPAPSGVFTRASSGLVRQVKAQDVIYYGWQQIALSYLVFIVLAWSAYPGASMEWATVLATVGGLALGTCYALLSTVYPRSGGEYVFISRIIHPAVGFTASFSFAFWQIFYYGINGAFLAIYALSPFCGVLGVQMSSPGLLSASTWFAGHWGIFVTGSVMVIFFACLQSTGLARYFRWQRWASYVAAVSLVITIIVLALAATGALDFKSNFDHLAGSGAYQEIIKGTTLASGSFTQTVKFMIWPAFSIWFAVASVSFSGEVKNVQRGQLIGINGAMISMGVAMVVLVYLYRAAFGSAFLLASSTSSHYTLAAAPFVNVFTGIAGNNVAVTILTFLWVLVIAFFVGGTCLVYISRAMLAWSIDGVAPEKLGTVNERFHSPIVAIVITAVLAEVWLGLFAFTSLLGPISGFIGFTLSFLLVSLTAIVFPFVKREMFENSPVAWRIGRVPVISLIGVVSLVFTGVGTARILVDHAYTPNLAFANVGALIVIAAGVVIFYAMRYFRRRQGLDIDQRYREIPIEWKRIIPNGRVVTSSVKPGSGGDAPTLGLRPLRGETLAVQAADAIRGLIAAGHVAGGERLVESRLAEQLGVSRGPVRDALRLLTAEGLVRDEPRRGTFVVRLTEQDVLDIYDLRIAVETAAVRLILRRENPEPLTVLKRAIEDMRAASLDARVAAEADLLFHGAVCELSGNSRLRDVHRRYATELLILLRMDEEKLPHEPGATVAEHEELLTALGRGPEAAEMAFRAHLEDARQRVAAYVRTSRRRR